MRPAVLDNGYGLGARFLFGVTRLMSGAALPDAARLTFYRTDFYGTYAKKLTHAAMRGESRWSVADRELMAAHVSTVNRSPFCIGAHTATAGQAYGDPDRVAAVLADLDSAPIEDGLKATLRMLGTLTGTGTLDADDMASVLDAGVSPDQIKDALAVGFALNTTARLANAFAFEMLTDAGFAAGATTLLKRGYR